MNVLFPGKITLPQLKGSQVYCDGWENYVLLLSCVVSYFDEFASFFFFNITLWKAVGYSWIFVLIQVTFYFNLYQCNFYI